MGAGDVDLHEVSGWWRGAMVGVGETLAVGWACMGTGQQALAARCCSCAAAHAGRPDPLPGWPAGAGLAQVLERGTKQVVEVPLTKGGRELGAVELCIQHTAMPGAK